MSNRRLILLPLLAGVAVLGGCKPRTSSSRRRRQKSSVAKPLQRM